MRKIFEGDATFNRRAVEVDEEMMTKYGIYEG